MSLSLPSTGIAVFAMNRPEARNAVSKRFVALLEEGIDSMRHSKDVRAVVLKSDVPGIFCAGADLKERPTLTEEEVAKFVTHARRMVVDLSELPMPIIAAIDGAALGGGLEIALACDIRVAGTLIAEVGRFIAYLTSCLNNLM